MIITSYLGMLPVSLIRESNTISYIYHIRDLDQAPSSKGHFCFQEEFNNEDHQEAARSCSPAPQRGTSNSTPRSGRGLLSAHSQCFYKDIIISMLHAKLPVEQNQPIMAVYPLY